MMLQKLNTPPPPKKMKLKTSEIKNQTNIFFSLLKTKKDTGFLTD